MRLIDLNAEVAPQAGVNGQFSLDNSQFGHKLVNLFSFRRFDKSDYSLL